MPSAPLPGGRDRDGRSERDARRQATRQAHADARMGRDPAWVEAHLELAGEIVESEGEGRGRRYTWARRTIVVALVAALLALVWPQVVDAVEPSPSVKTADGTLVHVLSVDAGHRLDGGRVREVEAGPDGAVWVAVGRRVLELGTSGSIEPRARGWQAFPRRLSIGPDGTLWAVEDGGGTVTLGETGWTSATPPEPGVESLALEEAALEQLREAGIVRMPRVLAAAAGPDDRRWLLVDVSARPAQGPTDRRLLHFDGTRWAVLGPDAGMPRDERRAWTDAGPEAPVALAVDGHGRAWFSPGYGGLWLADEAGVRQVRVPGLGSRALDLAGGADGAVWIASERGQLFRWEPEGSLAL